jgi:hypothetical protein
MNSMEAPYKFHTEVKRRKKKENRRKRRRKKKLSPPPQELDLGSATAAWCTSW